MKTSKDPRHVRRREAVQTLFAESYTKQLKQSELANLIIASQDKIDEEIKNAAPQWPLDKLNRIDLAILRLAVYELSNSETPPKVVIDEAVELAKEFGAESTPSFVNGVLGTIYKSRFGKEIDPLEKKSENE